MELGPWYDGFASIYDASVERVYAPYRAVIAEAAALSPGGVVLDVACGTGPNLPHLRRVVGPTGVVVGCDLSAGMLRRARAANPDATLIQGDAATVEGVPDALDAVVCSLGLSVIPDWERVLAGTWARLRSGGRWVVFDIHAERWVPQSAVVSWMSGADLRRAPWTWFEARDLPHERRWLDGSPHVHGGRPFLVVAHKPAGGR